MPPLPDSQPLPPPGVAPNYRESDGFALLCAALAAASFVCMDSVIKLMAAR